MKQKSLLVLCVLMMVVACCGCQGKQKETPYEEPMLVEETTTPSPVPSLRPRPDTGTQPKTEVSDATTYYEFLLDYEAWLDKNFSLMEQHEKDPMNAELSEEFVTLMEETTLWDEKAATFTAEISNMTPEEKAKCQVVLDRIVLKFEE